MGNLEIDSYFNGEDSISYLLRTLSAPSQNKNNTLLDKIATFGMDIAMIVAPLITYFFQINKFNKTKSSKGFSKLICFLLFMGNILRIFPGDEYCSDNGVCKRKDAVSQVVFHIYNADRNHRYCSHETCR